MSCCGKIKRKIKTAHEHFTTSSAHSENNKRFEIVFSKGQDRDQVCKILVDGGLISQNDKEKCDCVFYLCSDERFLFVELKGKSWPKPYNQILATIAHFNGVLGLNIPKDNIEGFVVAGGLPKASLSRRDKIAEFERKHGKKLRIITNQHIHKV